MLTNNSPLVLQFSVPRLGLQHTAAQYPVPARLQLHHMNAKPGSCNRVGDPSVNAVLSPSNLLFACG